MGSGVEEGGSPRGVSMGISRKFRRRGYIRWITYGKREFLFRGRVSYDLPIGLDAYASL